MSPAWMIAPATFPSRSNDLATAKPRTSVYQRIEAATSLQVIEQPRVVALKTVLVAVMASPGRGEINGAMIIG